MYTILRDADYKKLLGVELPPLATSMIVAEVFYKFHSFTLECIAFLATWALVGYGWAALCRKLGGRSRGNLPEKAFPQPPTPPR